MNKRLLTLKEEEVIRLCHHDHLGLSPAQAAMQLAISVHRVSEILRQVKKKAPQLFPILTQLEADCYHYYMIEGWSVKDIAEYMGKPESSVYKALQRARKKGIYFPGTNNKILSYDPSMDDKVKEKF